MFFFNIFHFSLGGNFGQISGKLVGFISWEIHVIWAILISIKWKFIERSLFMRFSSGNLIAENYYCG